MTSTAQGLGLDLELDAKDNLTALGATYRATECRRDIKGPPHAALHALDAFAAPSRFVYGHNILWHDLPWLARNAPDLALLGKPAVDTLALSAIAFAEYPYHHLLKGYKLVRDAINDPVADARIAGQLLADARQRLRELAVANPLFGRVVHSLSQHAHR